MDIVVSASVKLTTLYDAMCCCSPIRFLVGWGVPPLHGPVPCSAVQCHKLAHKDRLRNISCKPVSGRLSESPGAL